MIKNFEQYNEGLIDKMSAKSSEDVNMSLDGYIKKIEDILNSDPYDDSSFTAESFVDFISDYFGGDSLEDVVVKMMELEYITPAYILSDWVEGVDSVAAYSEEDSREQLKIFMETMKNLKQ